MVENKRPNASNDDLLTDISPIARTTEALPRPAMADLIRLTAATPPEMRFRALRAIGNMPAHLVAALPPWQRDMAAALRSLSREPAGSRDAKAILSAASERVLDKWRQAFLRSADSAARGTVRGIVNGVGAPVDFVSWLLGGIGLGHDRPLGGGKWIADQLRWMGYESDPDKLGLSDGERTIFQIAQIAGGITPLGVGAARGVQATADTLAGAASVKREIERRKHAGLRAQRGSPVWRQTI